MKLCIAEKPSVAKEIARIVGANSRRDGYFEGNDYCVSWTFGHLCTLKAPDDYTDQWKAWRFETLPMIPPRFGIKVIDDQGIKKQFGIIEQLVQKCTEVINCGDAGIEGELIQRWVLQKAKNTKPLKRLWISSLTDEAIKEGFGKLLDGADFDRLYAAGNARSIGDWLLGMNATRVYTLKYANGKGVLSIGRVQTPTLALIVQRHAEISNFKPEPFWELKTRYRNVDFNATKGRFLNVEEAQRCLELITGKDFTIISAQKKEGKESPPKLFDLTALQVECNKKFAFTADETLQTIQKLYESKLVSYPRVDTTFLPDDLYPKIKGILEKLKGYEPLVAPLLDQKIRKSKKVFDNTKVTDHHAIIPTGIAPSGLILNQKKVYDLILQRFVASFYPDCTVSNTTVLGEVEQIPFKATGKEILEPGWRVVFQNQEKESSALTMDGTTTENEVNEQIMPEFIEGESGPHEPGVLEKSTQPPKYYTEATLLRAMETAGKQIDDEELRDAMKDNGIGRPSTRAAIIETLFKRNYTYRERKNIIPTITGIQLIETIHNALLKSVELTGMWEKKLREIEKGKYEAAVFLDEMKTMVTDIIKEVKHEQFKSIEISEDPKTNESKPTKALEKAKKASSSKSTQAVPDKIICPKCQNGTILKGKTAFGCSDYAKGCTFKIPFTINGKLLSDKQIESVIYTKKTLKLNGFTENGIVYSGYVKLDNNFNLIVEPEAEKVSKQINQKESPKTDPFPDLFANSSNELSCPKCKIGTVVKGKTAYGCNQYKNGCHFRISFDDLKEYGYELNRQILHEIGLNYL